jgi:hypothetical protein
VSNTPIDNVAWVAVLGMLVGFGLYLAWRQARLVAIALACYSGLLLIWRWRVDRFLEPLLPVLLAMIVCAAVELGRRFVRPQVAWVPAALVAVLIGGATLIADARTVAAARRCDRRNPNASPACVSPIDRSFFAAVSYIGRTDSVTAPIVTPKEHTLSYYTGRSIIPLRRYLAVPAESSIDSLRKWGVNELIVAPMGPVQPRMFDRARAVCGGLIPVRTFGNDVLLFRLREPEEPVDPASCALVRGLTPVW